MKSIIIYSTRYGCAAETAKRIQGKLTGGCTAVNIKTDKVPPLDSYDTVILGGSIYIGRIQKEMTAFIKTNKNELLTKKLGLYICAGAQKDEERQTELKAAFTDGLLSHATAKDVLGCVYAFEKMRFIDKFILKKVKGNDKSEENYYDDQIEKFAKALSES
jgi:menaquinone-dependent protoporphyrinogen oxidase